MSNYFKDLSQVIMQKLKDIDKEDFINYYKYDEKFEMAMLLSFFALKEDEIISIDKNNPDIKTRYTLNIDQKELDEIFNLNNPIVIDSQEPDGDRVWLLSAIRNSLLHDSSFKIDFENKTIEINKDYNLNTLHCKIPFEFFYNFINIYQQKNQQPLYNQKYYGSFNDKYVEEYIRNNNITHLTENDLNKCINLIKPSVFAINKDQNCPDYDMNEIKLQMGLIYKIIHNKDFPKDDESQDSSKRVNPLYKAEFKPNYFGITEQKYNELSRFIKDELTNRGIDSYIIDKITDELIIEKMINKMLKTQYPGLSVKLDSSTDLEISKSDLITNGNILNPQISINEQLEILKRFSNEKKSIMTSSINTFIQKLYYNYSQNSYNNTEILKYISVNDFKRYMTSTNPEEKAEISNQYYKSVEKSFRESNKKLHFNNAIINDICYNPNPEFYKEDLDTYNRLRLEYLFKNHSEDQLDTEELELIPPDEYKWFFEKYSNKIIETNRNVLSDETRKFCFKDCSIQIYDGLFDSFNRNRLINAQALLYTMGINLFVFNKENILDTDSRSQNYEMLTDFTTYSKDAANNYQGKIQHQNTLNKEIRQSEKQYNNISANTNIPQAKKEKILADIQQNLNELKNKKSINDQAISGSKVKTINGTELRTEEDNTKKAKIIRNCLSHNGKINVSRDNNNQFMVELMDYNEEGVVTSYMEVSLEKLIDFINNEIHINIIDENEREQ